MENLLAKIDQQLIKGLKEKDQIMVDTLRMAKASIKNREIELGRELKEEEILKVLRSELKSRNEAIDKFKEAKRKDLFQKEEKEAEIIKQFLPEDLDTDKLESIVRKAIKKVEADSKADLGKVMPLVMKDVGGRASGEKIKNLVVKLLE